jgi:alkanesulfonate monooxygenase SsuD/methylene tetrahydromethanopterin reductase-like flavin-dependent oxidoreductase (luciferase family)
VTRLLVEGDKEFDYNGKYFQLKSVSGEPGSIQQPHPAIISAAYSPVGRDFAIRTSDFILTMFSDFDSAVKEVQDIRDREAKAGRAGDPLGLIGTVSITCRESRDEAEAFNHYYAVEHRDEIAVEQFVTARTANAASPYNDIEKMKIGAAGGGSIVGTPEDVVERLVQLRDAGFAGATLTTLNFLDDLPLIVNRVLPLMEEAGLRRPTLKNAA